MKKNIYALFMFFVLQSTQWAHCETNLPLGWEKTVVMLEKAEIDSNGSSFIVPHGTGFLYVDSILGTCLITNRHILAGRDSIFIRFNTVLDSNNADTTRFYREVCILKNKDGSDRWVGHREIRIDIGVVQLQRPKVKVEVRQFESDRLRLFADLNVGEEVFFYGYPLLIFGLQGQGDLPLLRSGIISFKSEKLTYLGNNIIDSGIILIDGFSFPGNSGSPVIMPFSNTKKGAVVGIVFGHIAIEHEAAIEIPPFSISLPSGDSATVRIPRHSATSSVNVGLAKAFCTDMILETIMELRKKLLTK